MAYPTGVYDTGEDSKEEDEDEVTVTKCCRNKNDRRSVHFNINKELLERRIYMLQERTRRKVSPGDNPQDGTDKILLIQHFMDQ